ncbi:MAG: hypothetical protein HGJ97_18305 [Desulfosporosinus sp.]|nr:glycosyltransferase family 1 protein [Desulfobacteraceae bacterium]MBC2719836.1 hypothetical protein [Desulfobacteraceae bacterium]MBC2724579.1 hypothetical protein [Desulfosporosinus sp.]
MNESDWHVFTATDHKPEKDILIADDPDVFAEKVYLLLRNNQKWEEIAEKGASQ